MGFRKTNLSKATMRKFSSCLLVLIASFSASHQVSSMSHLGQNCVNGDFLSQAPSDEVRGAVASGQRDFSVNLIQNMFNVTAGRGTNDNIFVSPSSIFQSLMMAYFGASGVTQNELEKVMGLEGVDFQKNSEKARKQINSWVEQKTLKKIRDLLPAGTVDPSTQMSLVNAAYFKGQWVSQFDPSETRIDNFYVKRDKIKIARFMKQKGAFNYYLSEELRAHVLQLPYQGESISMVVILPPFEDDAIKETVRRMTPQTIQGVMAEIKSGYYKTDDPITVELPKFHIEQSMELSGMIASLGASSLFGGSGDLTGFLEEGRENETPLTLNSARHKSYIEVNEEGSEAAAATALFGFRSARPLFHTEFVANHPFIFFIYDEETDLILFHGVLQDPTVNF